MFCFWDISFPLPEKNLGEFDPSISLKLYDFFIVSVTHMMLTSVGGLCFSQEYGVSPLLLLLQCGTDVQCVCFSQEYGAAAGTVHYHVQCVCVAHFSMVRCLMLHLSANHK